MRPRLRFVLPLVVFVAIAALLGVGLTIDAERVPSPLIGRPIPAFAAPALLDPERSVRPGDFAGEVWLLNVWATWCVPCRAEHEVLMHGARERDLAIVGLNYKDERAAAIDWLERLGDPYRVSASDPRGRVGIDLGVYGVPETYVIDADGIIRHKHIGELTREELEETIVPLVERLRGRS